MSAIRAGRHVRGIGTRHHHLTILHRIAHHRLQFLVPKMRDYTIDSPSAKWPPPQALEHREEQSPARAGLATCGPPPALGEAPWRAKDLVQR
jgi:hypothetical protein